jgi:hypothetical protein
MAKSIYRIWHLTARCHFVLFHAHPNEVEATFANLPHLFICLCLSVLHMDRQTDRHTDRQTDRQTDIQTDKQTDKHKQKESISFSRQGYLNIFDIILYLVRDTECLIN